MPAGATYEPIATSSPTSGTSVTFSSISSAYTDLVLSISAFMSGGTTLRLKMNGATSYMYQTTDSQGNIQRSTNNANIIMSDNNGTSITTILINIMNYSGGTLNQKCVVGYGGAYNQSLVISGSLVTTSAINSLEVFTTNGQTFASGSTITLYGIARA
jgi:hypothetical protein